MRAMTKTVVTCVLCVVCPAGGAAPVATRPATATAPAAVELSADQKRQIDALVHRVEQDKLRSISGAAGWTLCHCADPNEVAKLEPVLKKFGEASTARLAGDYSKFAAIGGARGVTDTVAGMLASPDGHVRGFAAVMLGVCGDRAYIPQLAKMLSEKPREEDGFDLGCAAMGLGLLGAEQHKAAIAGLLKDPRWQVASRSALGLGYMGAKEYAGAIAGLLTKDYEFGEVQRAALMALAELDARDQAPQIARMLDKDNTHDVDTSNFAAIILARLQARQYAGQIAKMLGDEFDGGDAAMALALLKSTDHAAGIAALLKSGNPLIRNQAALALGVLSAGDRASEVAALLTDKEEFVRPYAATALLLMDARQYAPAVMATIKTKDDLRSVFDWDPALSDEAGRNLAIAGKRLEEWRKAVPATQAAKGL